MVKIDKTGFNGCDASASPDELRILTTNHPYVKLWDAKTGTELIDLTHQVGLEQHWPFPFLGSFSPEGKRIVTASWDRTARIRDFQQFLNNSPPFRDVAPPQQK